jgi:hypothetical protein
MRQANIFALVKSLDTVPLGANRPSDAIKAGAITLHGPAVVAAGASVEDTASQGAKNYAAAGALLDHSQSAPPPSSSAGKARVYAKNQKQVHVKMESEGVASTSTATGVAAGSGGGVQAEGLSVLASNLPSFLTRSTKTGEAAREFGFVAIRTEAAQSSADTAVGGSQAIGNVQSLVVSAAGLASSDLDEFAAVDTDLNAGQRDAAVSVGPNAGKQLSGDADLWSLVWQSLAGASEGGGAEADRVGVHAYDSSAGADGANAREVGGAADDWEDA